MDCRGESKRNTFVVFVVLRKIQVDRVISQDLEVVLAGRTEIVLSTDGLPERHDDDSEDEDRVRNFAGPSKEAIEKFVQYGESTSPRDRGLGLTVKTSRWTTTSGKTLSARMLISGLCSSSCHSSGPRRRRVSSRRHVQPSPINGADAP